MSWGKTLFDAIELKDITYLQAVVKGINNNAANFNEAQSKRPQSNTPAPTLELKDTINAIDENRKTALMRAAELGWVDGVRELVENKINGTLQDKDGRSALHYAAIGGNTQCCALIFNLSKEQLSQTDNEKRTPIILAAKHNHTEAVDYFCEQLAFRLDDEKREESKSANTQLDMKSELDTVTKKSKTIVNLKDANEMSALMYAAENLNPVMTKSLIEAKADINLSCGFYQFHDRSHTHQMRYKATPLHIALYARNEQKITPSATADHKTDRQTETTKLLMNDQVVNAFDQVNEGEDYQTPLHLAAAISRTEIMQTMIGPINQGKIWVPMKKGDITTDLLTLAAQSQGEPNEQKNAINFLCTKLNEIKESFEEGQESKVFNAQRAFEMAASNCRHLAMQELWQNFPINLNVINNDNENLLFKIILANSKDGESFKGAVDTLDSVQHQRKLQQGKTKTLTKSEIKEYLSRKTTMLNKDQQPYSDAAKQKLLTNQNLDFNLRSNHPHRRNFTPLITAAAIGNQIAVEVLLQDKRVDVNAQDENGRTALHHAARTGHLEVLKALLADSRTDMSLTAAYTETVFHAADQHQKPEIILALIDSALKKQTLLMLLETKCDDQCLSFYKKEASSVRDTEKRYEDATKQKINGPKLTHEIKLDLPKNPTNQFAKWACHVIRKNQEGSNKKIRFIVFQRVILNFYQFHMASNEKALIHAICGLRFGLSNLTSGSVHVKQFLEGLLKLPLEKIKDEFVEFIQLLNPQQTNLPYQNLRQQLKNLFGIDLVNVFVSENAVMHTNTTPTSSNKDEKTTPSASPTNANSGSYNAMLQTTGFTPNGVSPIQSPTNRETALSIADFTQLLTPATPRTGVKSGQSSGALRSPENKF